MRMVSSVMGHAPKKRGTRRCLLLNPARCYPRQEPGRYLPLTLVPSLVLPQRQPNSDWLLPAVIVARTVEVDNGARVTMDVFTEPEIPCTVAVTTPLALVLMPATYLVACVAPISQPQPPAPGSDVGPD